MSDATAAASDSVMFALRETHLDPVSGVGPLENIFGQSPIHFLTVELDHTCPLYAGDP